MATTSTPSAKSNSPASGPRPFRPSWWWLLLVALLAGVPLLLRAPDAEQEPLEARRGQIENMTAAERERLEQNFARFQEMSPEKKAALREIEETVREDEGLKETLFQFERLLKTLSPWERAKIRSARSVEDKLAYVNAITSARKKEAYERQKEEEIFADMIKRYLTNFQGPGQRPAGGSSRVSENDLSNMMAVLDTDYASRVKLSSIISPGCAAYNLQLLAEALKANREQNEDLAREEPLPTETVRQMIGRISDPDAQALFKDYNSKQFVSYLAWKLETAWWNEARHNPPSQAELDETAKLLGGNELVEFERRKKNEPRRAYYQLLMATRLASFKRDTKELNNVLEELGLRTWRPNSGGGHKSGPPFGGDRGRRRDRDHDDGRKDEDDDKSRRGRGDNDRDREENRAGEMEPARAERPPRPDQNEIRQDR